MNKPDEVKFALSTAINLVVLTVTMVACLVQIVIPEIRRFTGLDKSPNVVAQQMTPAPMLLLPIPSVTPSTVTTVPTGVPATTPIPPTATGQSGSTPTPTSPQAFQMNLSVPCDSKAGTRVDVPTSERYMMSYTSGSYSPEPWAGPSDLHWRTRVNIYRNRNVSVGAREFQQGDVTGIIYYEPSSPDATFGGNYLKMTQSQSEAAARAAPPVELYLAKGEFLTLVCMDDETYFSDNQGVMKFALTATGR